MPIGGDADADSEVGGGSAFILECEVLDGGEFGVIVMDCMMPEMDDYHAAAVVLRREASRSAATPLSAILRRRRPHASGQS